MRICIQEDCSHGNMPQPDENFVKNRNTCKPCKARATRLWRSQNKEKMRAYSYRKLYGVSMQEYNQMLTAQGGKCAVCGGEQSSSRCKHLAIDHDHKTGATRGLLCDNCNRGIGHLQDDIGQLQKAIAYLEKYA